MAQDFTATLSRADPSGAEPGHLRAGPWRVTLEPGDAVVASHPDGTLHAVIRGSLYGSSPDALLRLYERHGPGFPLHLEGSYAALIVDGRAGRVLAVTDRVGTHALYAAHDGHRALVSTRPDWAPLRNRPLSVAGVSSVLVKGNLIGGLTLHDGVTCLRRACVHDLRADGIHAHAYWAPPWGRAPDTRPDRELVEELAHLLRAAVHRRAAVAGSRPHVSLSGGYDSRGLLSLLADSGPPVRTFSYALPGRTSSSDAAVAQRLAAQYGAFHTILNAYHGSVPENLRRNVHWGGGAAPLSDEADAWAEFAELHPTDVYVGDHAFHLNSHPLTDRGDQLLRQKVPPSFAVLSWLRGALPDRTYRTLEGEWHATLDGVLAHAGAAPGQAFDPYGLEVALMLDVNVAHSLLPWRSCYAGRVARVHLPYLDGDVLAFMERVPLHLMADKALYRAALTRLDPQLLRVPLARSLGYVPDWKTELIAQRGVILETLARTSSSLDDVIAPDVIGRLLRDLTPTPRGVQLRGAARQALGTLRRTPLALRVLGPARIRKTVDAATLLRRVLVLRALTSPSA